MLGVRSGDRLGERCRAEVVALRGEELLSTKLAALDNLRKHDIRCTLVCFAFGLAHQGDADLDEVAAIAAGPSHASITALR